ncbi:hypothetical protein C1646_62666 [Rhizophagus diaphanus]|nr:hypothetical protein C1646_62666 [Rhizophagus diaphanus] [Rhizophagus sp. MUCL 43196]
MREMRKYVSLHLIILGLLSYIRIILYVCTVCVYVMYVFYNINLHYSFLLRIICIYYILDVTIYILAYINE